MTRSLIILKAILRTSLVVQWLRIHLPIQGTQVQSPVWEDSTCHRATKTEPQLLSWRARAHTPRQENPPDEKPATAAREQGPLVTTRESLCTAVKTQHDQK